MTLLHRQYSMRIAVVSAAFAVSAAAQQAPRYVSPIAQRPTSSAPAVKPITPDAEVVEDMVVRVNDQIITRSDYERSMAQLEGDIAQNRFSPAEAEQRRKDLLRDMIDQQLLISKGKEMGINADAEMIRRLDEYRKQANLETMEDLEKAARQQGISFEDFKASVRNNIITGQVVREEVSRNIRLTHADEVRFYNEHKAQFEQPEQIHLSEILIATPATPTDADIAAAQKKAEDVAARLTAGEKFEDVAKAVSAGPTAAQGGDLGMFKRGALAQVLEDKTFVLQAGQNTAPIRTRQGFVILKVTEHIAAGIPPLQQIEPQVQEAMYGELMNPALRAYLTKLREQAYVDIRPGYTDSGSSARQTKPVFTAYVPPAPKKKEEKSRFDAKAGRIQQNGKPVAQLAAVELDKHGKPKKIKREKIRFGMAPRTALPAAPEDQTATAAAAPQDVAPGTVIAPVDQENRLTTALAENADPLAPKAPAPTGKVRYTSRQKEFEQAKAERKAAFAKEKADAVPDAPTVDEVRGEKTQAAPLGLNGDTTKKKVKRKKGDEKKRIQEMPQLPSETQKEVENQRNEDGTYKNPVPAGTGDTSRR